jgi:prepilin-type processing-associated H-X9-DG protein
MALNDEPAAAEEPPPGDEPVSPVEPAPLGEFQFSISRLLMITVGMAVVFAGLRSGWLGPLLALFMGLLWLATCVTLIVCGIRSLEKLGGLAALGAVGMLLGLCLFSTIVSQRGHGPASQRSQCINNLKQLAIALHMYESQYGTLPPPYVADRFGKPMHSWRVLLLPFLEQDQLYKQYRLDEPWDGPNNRKLHKMVVSVYQCPFEPGPSTSYLAVVGPGTPWNPKRPLSLGFKDGNSNTILLVESHNTGIHWMEPRDLHLSQMNPQLNGAEGQGISSPHEGGASVAFADGSVHFLPNTLTAEELRALLTADGGEPPVQLP